MGYEQAFSTKLLATHCAYCGRPLRDADSVENGMGPVCRARVGVNPDVAPDWLNAQRYFPAENTLAGLPVQFSTLQKAIDKMDPHAATNWLIHLASVIFSHGDKVGLKYADCVMAVHYLGYVTVAKVLAERHFKIRLVTDNGDYIVNVPRNDDFYQGIWQRRIGRWDRDRHAYRVPKQNRKSLWALLIECFDGECGFGPQGAFQVER